MRGGRVWGMLLLVVLAGCARHAKKPSVTPPPPVAVPEPRPPAGAASGLAVPEPGADGRFTTINSGVDGQEALWHVRSALNVAALACRDDPVLLKNYNAFLKQRKSVLAAAYREERAGQEGGATALDRHMTQLYNFFAQPPAQAVFCRVAGEEAARIVEVKPADLPDYAPDALQRLEAPILAFYGAYDRYRHDLAAWRANPHAVPAAPEKAEQAALASPTPTGESWHIQIGAFTGKDAAKAAWKQAQQRAPSLAAYSPHYEPVPGRPNLIRVQLGAADDRAGALKLCAAAAAGGFDCIPLPHR